MAEDEDMESLEDVFGDADTTDEKVDVEAIHPDFDEYECWNCGHTWHSDYVQNLCTGCLMGQEPLKEELRDEHENEDGYTDYGALWYGKETTLEERLAQYEKMNQQNGTRIGTDRTVRV